MNAPGATGTRAIAKLLAVVSWLASAGMASLGIWHWLHARLAFQGWRRWRAADASLADFFWTELELEVFVAMGCWFVALALAAAARRLPEHRRSDEHTGSHRHADDAVR
jgi:hypothetical protein